MKEFKRGLMYGAGIGVATIAFNLIDIYAKRVLNKKIDEMEWKERNAHVQSAYSGSEDSKTDNIQMGFH